jgi:oligopeptidase B
MNQENYSAAKASPPTAPKSPQILSCHGDERTDNYFWMRDRNDPKLIAYLEAENAYTALMMRDTEALQASLYDEMLARVQETELSVPYRQGDFYYYWRTEAGNNYNVFCRKRGCLDGPEEVVLDQNKLEERYNYLRLNVCEVSPNHQVLAYSIDTLGAEQYTLFFFDLTTFELYPESIALVDSFVWSNDSQTCFYTQVDSVNRPSKLFRHTLGSDPKEDILVHGELDEGYSLKVYKTRSQAYILLYLASLRTSEVRYLDANHPSGDFQVIHPRSSGLFYTVEHHSNYFYVVTNDEAINFKLMKTPVASPSKENWQTVIPHRERVTIKQVSAFADHLAIYEREGGLPRVRICQLSTGDEHYIDFPDPVYELGEDNNPEYSTNILRFGYRSLVTPNSIFDYNMVSRESTLKKQMEVLGGYDKTQYKSEIIWATAADGTQIPISLVYKDGIEKDGQNPLLLTGYGAYAACEYISFSPTRLSLLDRGVIIAIAHVRGGGEMGRQWYEDGKFLKKKNTFTDFIACAEHLVANKWTASERLAIVGESGGGLLIGAALNMRPNLFKVAVAKAPFVDILTSILDTTLPLSVLDWEEWGNPNDKTYYEYIKSYAPYDNVEPKDYPHLLITTALNDSSVPYWEPVKWTAKLRENKTDDNILLLKINMSAGHRGASGRYDILKEVAFEYAFILERWGLNLRK